VRLDHLLSKEYLLSPVLDLPVGPVETLPVDALVVLYSILRERVRSAPTVQPSALRSFLQALRCPPGTSARRPLRIA
jgi:hypothetical protein